jgi:hypothetical protein
MVLTFPRKLRALVVAAVGLAVLIVALTWMFSLRYRLYVPAFFGVRRLFDYSSIPVILLGMALVERGMLGLERLGTVATAGAVAVVLAVSALFLVTARVDSPAVSRNRPVVDAFTWIRTHVPCEARILPDAHSEGVFEALTGRVSILEGPTPYLRPGVREPVLRLLLDVRRFFEDPVNGQALLRREGVDYVAAIKTIGIGDHSPTATADPVNMARATFLKLIHTSGAMDVYQVLGPPSGRTFPRPNEFPGYRCVRTPVET